MTSEKRVQKFYTNDHHNPDLGSASDWLKICPDHQYGISALVSQMLFCGETSGGLAKCRLYFSGSVTRDPSNMRVTWDFTVSLL